jgi:hypothetical protein
MVYLGNKARAVELLRESAELGMSPGRFTWDATLKTLRGDPDFEEIVAEARRRQAVLRERMSGRR